MQLITSANPLKYLYAYIHEPSWGETIGDRVISRERASYVTLMAVLFTWSIMHSGTVPGSINHDDYITSLE